ncbi:MAG: MFS transporter [Rhodospirillales bacterium]|nr:MAG: MFS transporter [Rhodospirillales bacterium]
MTVGRVDRLEDGVTSPKVVPVMASVVLSLSALLAGTFLMMIGSGVLGTLVPLRLGGAGYPADTVGIVTAGYFAGLVLGGFHAHRLIARVGHIRSYAALASCFAAATLAHGFLLAPVPWLLLRVVQGICMAGLFICIESWLNQQSPDLQRGRVLSLYMIVVYLAQAAGQFALPLPDPSGFALFALTAIVVTLGVVPVAAARVVEPQRPEPARVSLGALFSVSPIGVSGAFAAGLGLGAFHGLGPWFTQEAGLDVAETARFMAGAIVGGMVLQWPIGMLSDRFERRTVLAGVGTGVGAVSVVMLVLGEGHVLIYLSPALGAAIFALYPLSVAQANDRIAATDRLGVSGGLVTTYGVGAALGPVLAAAVIGGVGPGGLFIFIGGVGVAFAVYATVRRVTVEPATEAEKVPFVALPRTTPLAGELDPRSESAEHGGEAEDSGPGDDDSALAGSTGAGTATSQT